MYMNIYIYIYICYLPAGKSVWWKTVTEVVKMLPSAAIFLKLEEILSERTRMI